jgi:PAS domain S-box-containing protein
MFDFFEFSNEMLCLADHRGYFVRVNPAWTKTMGWSADELTSRPFVDFVHPDDLAATIHEAELLQSGSHETIFFENRYRRRDGSYRWLAWRAVLEPATRQLVATARDITDQKLQAQALLESEERFRLLATRAPIGIAQADAEGSVFFANSKWCEMAGVTTEEAMGFAWKGCIHPEDLTRTFSHWQSSLRAGQDMLPVEFRFLHRNGDIRWASSSSTLLKDAAGKITGQIVSQQDITERKEAENAVRESEERFRALATQAPVGIFQDDRTASCTFVNEHWHTMTGLSSEESLGYGWMKAIHPDDLPRVMANWEACVREQREYADEYRLVRRNGEVRSVITAARAIKDAQGNVVNFIGTLLDITERKVIENALRESEERFRALATKAPVAVYQADESGRLLFINQRWYEMTGLTAEESSGIGWQRAIHPDDLDDLNEKWAAATAAHEEYANEFRIVHKDGSIRWLTTSAAAIRDPQGRVVSHIGMSIDVTERKVIEEKLRLRESQLTGILDNTAAVVYLKDSEGRYLLANRHWQGLFRHLGDSVIGKTDREFFPAPFAEGFLEADAKVWREQAPIYFEETAPHADGPHTYRSVKFPVRDEMGKMIALGGISTDISDLKEAQEALRTKQQLLQNLIEVQEKEKQFLCHEFHDGLIQYAFGSAMLLESCRSNPQAADNASKIDTVIDNLRRGVEDGRRVIRGIRPAVLDDSGLEAAMEDLVGQFETSGMLVTSKCDPEIGRLPESIQTTVYRVVQEALNNAKKYSGTDVVRIELKKINGDLYLEVRDFGCGFDVESARKKGFGLTGMTERVRLLGGECQIQSERDAGTRISVRVPLSTTEVKS